MAIVWFQAVAVALGLVCLVKGALALLFAGRFYGWRRRQYDAARMPAGLHVLPLCFLATAAVSWWLAPGAGGAAWGITAFLSVVALLGLGTMIRWRGHSAAAVAAIDAGRRKVAVIDGALVGLGGLFLAVAFTAF